MLAGLLAAMVTASLSGCALPTTIWSVVTKYEGPGVAPSAASVVGLERVETSCPLPERAACPTVYNRTRWSPLCPEASVQTSRPFARPVAEEPAQPQGSFVLPSVPETPLELETAPLGQSLEAPEEIPAIPPRSDRLKSAPAERERPKGEHSRTSPAAKPGGDEEPVAPKADSPSPERPPATSPKPADPVRPKLPGLDEAPSELAPAVSAATALMPERTTALHGRPAAGPRLATPDSAFALQPERVGECCFLDPTD